MLKVLHVIAHLAPGGSERQLAGMVRAAHGVHWEATLCVLNPGYPMAAELAADGVPVIELEQRRRWDVDRVRRLRRRMQSDQFDIAHATLWRGGLVTRLAATYRGRPAVVLSERSVETFRPLRERLLDRMTHPLVDHYIGNSADVAGFIEWAHAVPATRVTVVENGIDAGVFRPDPRRVASGGSRLIGSVGRLGPEKGYDVLLEALPHVLRRHDVVLQLAGSGDEEPRLRALAADLPVEFLGQLPTPESVADFLRTLDLFVLPSRYEGRPNAVLEARMCGIPVVATNVSGMAAALGTPARLVPPDDPAALADGIVAALGDQTRPAPVHLPSFDDVARQHLAVFESVVAERARS